MHQSPALQRVIGPFLLQVTVCQSTQFVVDKRQKNLQRFFIAGLPLGQKSADGLG
jgi:hypothetical protein